MQPNQWEIIVLKPSPAFLSFIGSQLPELTLPEYRLLQTDNTGYVLQQQGSDEELLDEIERQYPKIFKYEIERWFGLHIEQDIKASFLDFLCCFKFDLHSHILLMEPTVVDARQMISVKPRSVLTKWVRSRLLECTESDDEVLTQVDMSQWGQDATVIVKNLDQVFDLKPFLRHYYNEIYEAEVCRIGEEGIEWPVIDSYQMFCRYFAVELHTQLVHLL
ncbi:MAG: hypothetical protein NTW08_00675 [Gammaproteobacteria bacterium]|nr:hypothetical protein [Gammaproteobacteria bacterium]